MKNRYPDKVATIELLLEVARNAAFDSNADHPEDIAQVMSNAIEHGAAITQLIWKRGGLS